MTFEIEINGRGRTVGVERIEGAPSRFRVTVDGRTLIVDAVRVEADTLSILLPDDGYRSHEVGFSQGLEPGQVTVHLQGGTLTAVVDGRRSRRGAALAAAGEQRIVAPMPGKVIRVLVEPGDEVAGRQPLVVVEAMKMENELSSPRAGRVKEVAVRPGQSVEAGRLLVVVE
jgi:biotin carboxyl carrier protein